MSEAHKKDVKLTLDGEGLHVEQIVTAAVAARIVAFLYGSDQSQAGATPTTAPSRGLEAQRQRVSLREYLDKAGAKRNPEKICCMGGYAIEILEQESFSRDEIRSFFRKAGEPVPGNFARDFQWTCAIGWIAEDHSAKGSYYVTSKGKEAISKKFGKEVRASSKQSVLGRRKKKQTANT